MRLVELVSLLAIVLTVVGYVPYIRDIRAGQLRPHFFSWLIWTITTSVVFFAQLSAQGGAGAWPTGVSAAITFYVAWLAFRLRADIAITRSDQIFLLASFSALPVWFLTADPLWSVVILTIVDVLGFGPTLRHAYARPQQESLAFYVLFALRSVLSAFALESLSVTTLLFPVAMVLSCAVVCVLLWFRRRELAGQNSL